MYLLGATSRDMFPTRASFFVFWAYILLFVSQGLLVKALHKSQSQSFSTVTIVLLTELVKLIICIGVYLIKTRGDVFLLQHELTQNRKLLVLYLVPAFLYCLYNNLTFINLELFDLATYYCLMQFRIVLTAVIYQILFRRQLTYLQWASLIILTTGCLVKEYGMYDSMSNQDSHNLNMTTTTSPTTRGAENSTIIENHKAEGTNQVILFFWSTLLLLLQMFCSCFAGVYNEFLLKDKSTSDNADVILQNMFMYFDSILCNLVAFKFMPNIGGKTSNKSLKNDDANPSNILYDLFTNPLIILLIFNNAFSGLVASFFLKNLNSILKTFASALELFAITFFAWMMFSDHVDMYTITALVLVSAAIIVYSKNPVSTAPPGRSDENRDGFVLLPTSEE